jgi:hypothetical protein
MNECHMNFASSNKFVFQMCFQCTILVCETYDYEWKKIDGSITKSGDVKFVMLCVVFIM